MLSFNAEHGGMRMGIKRVWRKRSGTKKSKQRKQIFFKLFKTFNITGMLTTFTYPRKIAAHGRSQITTLLLNPHVPMDSNCDYNSKKEVLSIAHDGYIRGWEVGTWNLTREVKIRSPYLMCMIAYRDGFLLGLGSGEMVELDSNLVTRHTYKFHTDCVTQIIQTQNHIITIGHDGRVNFLHALTLQRTHTYLCAFPITHGHLHRDVLYLTASPHSFAIYLPTKTVRLLPSYVSLIQHSGHVYGMSDVMGLNCLCCQETGWGVSGELVLSVGQELFVFGEGCITTVAGWDHEGLRWRVQKVNSMDHGYAMLTSIEVDGYIIGGSQCGNIFVFARQEEILNYKKYSSEETLDL